MSNIDEAKRIAGEVLEALREPKPDLRPSLLRRSDAALIIWTALDLGQVVLPPSPVKVKLSVVLEIRPLERLQQRCRVFHSDLVRDAKYPLIMRCE